jgi:hypothetical protein
MHRGGTVIRLVEDQIYWRVQSWEAAWRVFTTSINSVAGGGSVTLNTQSFRYLVTANKVEIECTLAITVVGVVNSFIINSINAIYPVRSSSTFIKHYADINANNGIAEVTGNIQIRRAPVAAFTVGANNITFRLAYELNT